MSYIQSSVLKTDLFGGCFLKVALANNGYHINIKLLLNSLHFEIARTCIILSYPQSPLSVPAVKEL